MTDGKDIEAQLREAREQVEQLKDAREAREAEAELRAELVAAKREIEDEQALAKAQEEYGIDNVRPVRTPIGMVIVRKPKQVSARKFVDAQLKSNVSSADLDKFTLPYVVHPEKAEYARMVDDMPAIANAVGDACIWLCGFGRSKFAEKSSA